MIKNYLIALLASCCLLIEAQPSLKPITGPSAFCSKDQPNTYSTSATPAPLYYTWSVLPFNGVQISSPNTKSTTITFPFHFFKTYTVSCTASNATGTSLPVKKVVTVSETPMVTFSGAHSFCQGSSTNLQASPTTISASSTISYKWTPSTGLSSTTGPTVNAHPSQTTTYTVLTAIGSCTNNVVLKITVLNCITGINYLGEEPADALQLYPNPSSEYFNLKSTSSQRILIINQLGQTIRSMKLEAGVVTHVEGLPSGLYYIVTEKLTYRVVVTR